MKKINRYWLLILLCCAVVIGSGCETMKEGAKGFLGLSTKILQDGRKDAVKKTFNYDYKTCYDKVKKFMIEKGSYIYAQDMKQHMIAIYVSNEDTTPVGIFFTEIDPANTQIEVSSPNTYAKEFIANRISRHLEGLPDLELGTEKGSSDGTEQTGM